MASGYLLSRVDFNRQQRLILTATDRMGQTPSTLHIWEVLGQELGRNFDGFGRIGQVAEDKQGHGRSPTDTWNPLKLQGFRSRSLGAGDGNRTRVLSLGS